MIESGESGKLVVALDGNRFELTDGAQAKSLRGQVEQAVASGGRFIDFITASGDPVAVLITPRSRVTISVVREIQPDFDPPAYPTGMHIIDEI